MSRKISRKLVSASAGIAIAAGGLLSAAAPAQAYSPDPKPTYHARNTSKCPCYISDVIDGTQFKKDPGGKAMKIDLWKSGNYIGKVEYHPYGEHLYVYDNKADNDAIYVTATHWNSENGHPITSGPFKGKRSAGDAHHDLSHPEGEGISIKVWDSVSGGKGSDLIASATAVA